MAKPKVIIQLYPMLPTENREEREQKRPLARDKDLYHHVLHEWVDIVKAADEMGVWGISTIEHHLHSEGYEVGPNPGVLNAWWAAQVKNARVGALGYVWRRRIRFAWPRKLPYSIISPRVNSSAAWRGGISPGGRTSWASSATPGPPSPRTWAVPMTCKIGTSSKSASRCFLNSGKKIRWR